MFETIGNMSPYIEGGLITNYTQSIPLMSADGLVAAQQGHDTQVLLIIIIVIMLISMSYEALRNHFARRAKK